jgi:hypothetical protein
MQYLWTSLLVHHNRDDLPGTQYIIPLVLDSDPELWMRE